MSKFSFKYIAEFGELIDNIEIWKTVTYPCVKNNMYEVSSNGRIRRKDTGVEMSYRNHRGYITTQLMTINGKSREFRTHRIVAYEFVPGRSTELVINHKDGVKTNNNYHNLEWVTQRQNVEHAIKNNLITHIYGEQVNTAKITENDVKAICQELLNNNGDVSTICDKFPNISKKIIRSIRNKKTWCHISDNYFDRYSFNDDYTLTDNDVEYICETLTRKDINGDIHKTLDIVSNQIPKINEKQILSIKTKQSYKYISDKFFDDKLFRQRLLPEDAESIAFYLKKFNGDKHAVLKELSDNPRVNIYRIKHILDKESHVDISDKYFKKSEFVKSYDDINKEI